MTRVFLIEEPRGNINLTTARDFGTLQILFPLEEHRTSVFNCIEFGEHVISKLQEANFDNDNDLVCVCGSMVTVVVAMAAILTRYKRINVLFFNATVNHYVKRTLGE